MAKQRLPALFDVGKRRTSSPAVAGHAALAQLVEHRIRNAGVTGSSPVSGTTYPPSKTSVEQRFDGAVSKQHGLKRWAMMVRFCRTLYRCLYHSLARPSDGFNGMARTQAFSDKVILNLHNGRLPDPLTAGLSIDAKAGTRTWRYYRRVKGSPTLVRITLGTYPTYSLTKARKWAAGLNEKVEAGIDPRAADRAAKAATMTFGEAWALYWTDTVRGTRRVLKPRSLADKRGVWTGDVEPHLGAKALTDIKADDLWRLVERKGDTAPVRANRLAGELKVMWGWFVSRAGQRAGIRIDDDPTATLSARYFAQSPGRTRILSDEELGWFLRAVAPETASYRRALTLMLLTGCRFSEVVEAPVSEYRSGTWTIPAGRTKNAQAHVIALGPWARDLFEQAQGAWLAPNSNGSGLVERRNWYRVRDRVHARMQKLAGRPINRWGFHDLRRTLRSNTFRLGIAFEVAEAMLNHARQGLERRYDLADLSGFTRDGFARWEAHVAGIARAAGVACASVVSQT